MGCKVSRFGIISIIIAALALLVLVILAVIFMYATMLLGSYLPVNMLKGIAYNFLDESDLAAKAFEASRVHLEQAAQDNPEDARVFSSFGKTLAGLNRKQEAIAAGRYAVELYPVSLDAFLGADRVVNLAQIYAMVGEVALAIGLMQEILSTTNIYTIYNFELDPNFDTVRMEPSYQELRDEFIGQP